MATMYKLPHQTLSEYSSAVPAGFVIPYILSLGVIVIAAGDGYNKDNMSTREATMVRYLRSKIVTESFGRKSALRQYTGDYCEFDTSHSCLAPRRCVNVESTLCNSSNSACFCFATEFSSCNSSTECLYGDRCTNTSDSDLDPFCISCFAFDSLGAYTGVDNGAKNCPTSTPEAGNVRESFGPTSSSAEVPSGTTGDSCTSISRNCASPRECKSLDDFTTCTYINGDCICASDEHLRCSASSDCLYGDRCITNTDDVSSAICFSCQIFDRHLSGSEFYAVDDGSATCLFDGELKGSPPSPNVSIKPLKTGYTFENCTAFESTGCASPRSCFSPLRLNYCDEHDDWCVCASHNHLICSKSSECLHGDRCVTYSTLLHGICVTCFLDLYKFSPFGLNYIDDDRTNCGSSPDSFSPSPLSSASLSAAALPSASPFKSSGYTFDNCTTFSYNCRPPRSCLNHEQNLCDVDDYNCYCVSHEYLLCTSSFDCLFGDRCVEFGSTSPVCLSCNITDDEKWGFSSVDDIVLNCPDILNGFTTFPSYSDPVLYLTSGPRSSETSFYPFSPSSLPSREASAISSPTSSSIPLSSHLPDVVSSSSPEFYFSPSSKLSPSVTSEPSLSISDSLDGYTGIECTATSFICISPRICYSADTDGLCNMRDSSCLCLSESDLLCTTSSDCLYGDRCVKDIESLTTLCLACSLADLSGLVTYVDDGGENCSMV